LRGQLLQELLGLFSASPTMASQVVWPMQARTTCNATTRSPKAIKLLLLLPTLRQPSVHSEPRRRTNATGDWLASG